MKKTKMLSFRTTDENLEFLEKVAEADDRSVSWVISKMIDYFHKKGDPKKAIKELSK